MDYYYRKFDTIRVSAAYGYDCTTVPAVTPDMSTVGSCTRCSACAASRGCAERLAVPAPPCLSSRPARRRRV